MSDYIERTMKHKNKQQRPNQKVKRQSARTNKGCRYSMTSRGFVPRDIVERFN